MSHRKFEHPRCGSLGFLPRKRTRKHHGHIRKFPKDDKKQKLHLTAYCGFKAGMTHIVREVTKPGSRLHKKECVEAVTIIECPKMVVVGIVGYIRTPRGLKAVKTLFAEKLSECAIRRFYKRYRGRNHYKAFNKYQKHEQWTKDCEGALKVLKKRAAVIRVIAHPKMEDMKHLRTIKAPLIEIQINGGSVDEKVEWAKSHLEKEVRVGDVFTEGQFIDVLGATKGHGYEGVTHRYGTKKLQRKTHRGLRKVACIGSWHPSRVQFTAARAGQDGYHHRTELNKRIYRIGKSALETNDNASTEADITAKNITPMGGFGHYGIVKNDYVMIKGCCVGIRKRTLVLREAMFPKTSSGENNDIALKFIDTSSKLGHGRFQTKEDKDKFFGKKKEKKTVKVQKKYAHSNKESNKEKEK
ncbi:MAG: 50S ribosomal protein L3 [Clostridia bacterium]|nr:50S ribosomal protein L3 [Clostridia bacterium]